MADLHPIPYPAQIQIIDTNEKTFYMLRGYLSLEDMKAIAKSIG